VSVSVFEFEVVLLGLHSSRGRALQSRYSREVGDGYGIKARRLEEEFKENSQSSTAAVVTFGILIRDVE
jgi:hypothetical protein